MMHLIDDDVGRRLRDRPLILCPTLGICLLEVDDGTTLAIHAYGLGKDTWALALTHIKGIELTHQVAFHSRLPLLVGCACHLNGLQGLAAKTFLIDTYDDLFGVVGCKECEHGLLG